LHCCAKDFREKIRKGKLGNVTTVQIGSDVLEALQDGGEICGKVIKLTDDYVCIDCAEGEGAGNKMKVEVEKTVIERHTIDSKVGDILDCV
jgi:hypothetical protein